MLDERELIDAAVGGRREAFGELVRRHQEIAVRTAYLITRSESDARDAAQDAFVKAYLHLHQLRDPSMFRAWLLRIVGNEARNRIRSEARWRSLSVRGEDHSTSATPDPEATVLDSEGLRSLLRTVEELRGQDRLVIACRYFLELSEAETAEALGWPRGTVKSRLSRALQRLREDLTEGSTVKADPSGGRGHA
jgi:RNA polymerase sigma-70 factor, ECF subfamily